MDSANNHPYKMAIVNDDDFYANNHPYKVKIVEGGGIGAKVVDELPETGESGYIYLVLKEESEEGDIYDEWIWAEKDGEFTWEHLGATNEVTITLYDSTGQNTDGAMTQKAVTDALKDVEEIANSKAASVNGDGDSWVREASQIHTDTTQSQSDMFIFRTTAGSLSISTGEATLYYIGGNTVKSGYSDEVLELTGEFDNPGTTAEIDADVWRTQVAASGDYEFTYDGEWKLSGSSVDLGDYGITVTGEASEGDSITVGYQAQVIGTLTTAKPTSFVATGFNQYNATAGYAHVVGGQEYRIDGTYTSLEFATEIGGTTTQIVVDENSKFIPEDDGYVSVNGASGDILIALVWSGIMDSEPFSEYETSTIAIPTVDINGENLPTATYGMPSIGDVHDRMNLSEKVYTQNIGHYPYSVENLATVKAMGVDYIYDLTDIFYVLEEPIQHTLPATTEAGYIANDFGTEEFVGTDVPVRAGLVYGNNLVDKLRNILDIQSLGEGLTLNGGELSALVDEGIKIVRLDYNGGMNIAWADFKEIIGFETREDNPTGIYHIIASNAARNFVSFGNIQFGYASGTSDVVEAYLVLVASREYYGTSYPPGQAGSYLCIPRQLTAQVSSANPNGNKGYHISYGRWTFTSTENQGILDIGIVDRLNGSGTDCHKYGALSAYQGYVLNNKIEDIAADITYSDSEFNTLWEEA